MLRVLFFAALAVLISCVSGLRYDPDQVNWNLNQNQSANDPLTYWGQWPNHSEFQHQHVQREMTGLTL